MSTIKRFYHLLGLNLGLCGFAFSILQVSEFLFTANFSITEYFMKSPFLLGIMISTYIFLSTIPAVLFSITATAVDAIRGKRSSRIENLSLAVSFSFAVLAVLLLYRWMDIPISNVFFADSFKMRGIIFIPILLSAAWFFRLTNIFLEKKRLNVFFASLEKISRPAAFILPVAIPVLLFLVVHNLASARSDQILSGVDVLSRNPAPGAGEGSPVPPDALRRESGKTAKQSNLILITLDTLRADHLHLYGYNRIRTPNIDKLGNEGAVFINTITQSSVTLPSHSSLLTSRIPPNHGVRNGSSYYLGDDEITLQEVLGARGYRTAAFVSAEPLNYHFGISQGFSVYDDRFASFWSSYFWRIRRDYNFFSLGATIKGMMPLSHVMPERRGDKTIKAARDWLEKYGGADAPFFVWIHLFDAHRPYAPPEPFDEMYHTPVTSESKLDETGMPVSRQIDLYDGEISFVDNELGKFFSWLKSRDIFDSTLKVVTSDHGESFEKDYLYNHAKRLYESIVRVPLIFHHPHLVPDPRRIEQQVRLIDVSPTILELLNFSVSLPHDGVSLAGMISGGNPEGFPLYATSETDQTRKGNLVSLRTPEWKMVYGIDTPERSLYRLGPDPLEEDNLFRKEPDSPENAMRSILETYIEGGNDSSGVNRLELSTEFKEKLKALGYVE